MASLLSLLELVKATNAPTARPRATTIAPIPVAVNATANALAPAAAVFCATPTAVNAFAKPKLRAV